MKGNKEEEDWTYAGGRGEPIKDYMLGDERVRDQVEKNEGEGQCRFRTSPTNNIG